MRKAVILTILILIAGCGPKPDIAGRKAYWEGIISRELPPGMSESAIRAWGRKRGIEFSSTGSLSPQNTLTAWVESIPDHSSFICDKWMIHIEITLNSKQESTGSKVESVGSCL